MENRTMTDQYLLQNDYRRYDPQALIEIPLAEKEEKESENCPMCGQGVGCCHD